MRDILSGKKDLRGKIERKSMKSELSESNGTKSKMFMLQKYITYPHLRQDEKSTDT